MSWRDFRNLAYAELLNPIIESTKVMITPKMKRKVASSCGSLLINTAIDAQIPNKVKNVHLYLIII